MAEEVSEFWQAKIAAHVAEVLAAVQPKAGAEYHKAVARQCPFKEGKPLCVAWYKELRRQHLAEQSGASPPFQKSPVTAATSSAHWRAARSRRDCG